MIEIDNNSRVLFFGDSVTDIDFNRQYDYLLHGKQVYALNIGEEIKKKFPNAEVFYKGIVDDRTYNLCNRMDDDCIAPIPINSNNGNSSLAIPALNKVSIGPSSAPG